MTQDRNFYEATSVLNNFSFWLKVWVNDKKKIPGYFDGQELDVMDLISVE